MGQRKKQYVPALNKDGKGNAEYYEQDLEFDAFAFAYAVIKYKYGDVRYIFKPTRYGKEFDEMVENWCQTFQSEGL